MSAPQMFAGMPGDDDGDDERVPMVDFQCARCGSSITIETCEHCGGLGTDGHECGEDCCSCADPENNVACQICEGKGHYGVCLSSPEWCEANPLAGRADVPRNTVEEYEIP